MNIKLYKGDEEQLSDIVNSHVGQYAKLTHKTNVQTERENYVNVDSDSRRVIERTLLHVHRHHSQSKSRVPAGRDRLTIEGCCDTDQSCSCVH